LNRSLLDFILHATLVLGAVLGLLTLLLVEAYQAFPIPLRYYLWFAAIWTVLLLARFRLSLGKKNLALLLAVLTVLTIFYSVPWHPRKPFLRAFHQIEPGMSEAEVREIMAGYDFSRRKDSWTFDVPNDWLYDSDWGSVHFANGNVTQVSFSPD